MKEKWQVHGIDIPDVVDELIEWDNGAGLTNHQLDKVTHQRHVICFVPRDNTPVTRTVTRHEFLHARFDSPTVREARESGGQINPQNISTQVSMGVADAFVHLVYWPAGQDETADREAVEMALFDLHRIADDLDDRANWNIGLVLLITLRSAAVLRLVGTEMDQIAGSKLILSYLTANQLRDLNRVLDQVQRKDREQAEKLMQATIQRAEIEEG